MPDFNFTNHGSICILTPVSDEAKQWLEDYVITDETMFWGDGVVVEPRYVDDLLGGITSDGMEVE